MGHSVVRVNLYKLGIHFNTSRVTYTRRPETSHQSLHMSMHVGVHLINVIHRGGVADRFINIPLNSPHQPLYLIANYTVTFN